MKIDPFAVEIWMNAHETGCAFNLAETCVDSLTVAELLEISGGGKSELDALLEMRLSYGAIEGSDRLRAAIAALYDRQKPQNIIVTHGAAGANALVHQALIEPGDRVVSVVPTYQQHVSIPESMGAKTARLELRWEDDFRLDMDELARLAVDGTKLIVLTNPNNPTGVLIDRAGLEEIVGIARGCGAWVLCDEVYRGTDQSGPGATVSIADLYEKGISTGSMSKAFSLAGLRLGWICAPKEIIEAVSIHRDYNTISVGMIDDHFAALALENADAVLARSRRITRTNLGILSEWVERETLIDWVKPQSGTVAMLRYRLPMSSEEFCLALLTETGVMLTPGSAFGMEGFLRIGYANEEAVLREGLRLMSGFLAQRARSAA
ncbi:aminotransferase [Aliihoeflea aestuarii]|jgi:aspartate/methionine/tyrosine aminotransferase|uniref:aminotransferase n=1 Tax=Aliihoeflea aestuarii TaxID=453840 RepID=UPI0020933A7A|nr:aminotransferase [Aliihoeflea aestuarii]MCO6391070.1 aminotransferase [Aliihoeflea aestuarii]